MTTPDPIAGAIEALAKARNALVWANGELKDFPSGPVEGGPLAGDFAAIEAALTALRAHRAAPEGDGSMRPLPMENAPRDGTVIRLFTRFAEHPLSPENDGPQWTIGQNWRDFTDNDEWLAVGWNGTQDCYTTETVSPIGWLPFHATNAALIEALRQIEEYREAYKEAEAERPAPVPELREAVEEIESHARQCSEAAKTWENTSRPELGDEQRAYAVAYRKAAEIFRAALSRLPVEDRE